jgi:bifunctional non-homologous end joining protein LigD
MQAQKNIEGHVFVTRQRMKLTARSHIRQEKSSGSRDVRQADTQQQGLAGRMRSVRSSNKVKLTHYITPMLASIREGAFDDEDWIFEIKWDGYRAIAEIGDTIRLYSRNGLSFLPLYPQVADELSKIKAHAVLDGEIVALNSSNKPDFQKLQQYDSHRSLRLIYYVFDCLYYEGRSLMHLPLTERKKFAQKVIPESNVIKYSDHVQAWGTEFFGKAVDMGLEGIIAKRAASLYTPGKRTRDWLKIKNHNIQEAIITGYTAPRASRPYFGALVLALMVDGKLKYIGHTGTGFTQETLQAMHRKLQSLKRDTSPFAEKVIVNSPVTWVEPVLVCNIKFTEVTEDGILRHPVFMGLRIDKTPEETTTMDVQPKIKKTGKAGAAKKAVKHSPGKEKKLKANGHVLTITNPDKLYWPGENITKGDVINYYNNIHSYILPYLKNRPQSLKRNPNGIMDEGFYQKDAAGDAPDWVDHIKLRAESANKNIDYILCNNRATLLYLNNLGCIELNPWNSSTGALDHPDYLVMDIDPSESSSFNDVVDAALVIRSILDKAGAPAYCKTSGATGLHVYVPLKAQYTYEQARSFAEIIAQLASAQLPSTTTTERSLTKRNGKIYLDYLQNKRGQTLASAYSLRPVPGATISTPLRWKEVKPGLHPSKFNIRTIGARLEKNGDLFSGVLKERTDLSKCLKNLGA